MDFQKLLLSVGQALRRDEVSALCFLCRDLLRRGAASAEASELFSQLAGQDLLSAERPGLLTELLLVVQRQGLVRSLDLHARAPVTEQLIPPYRKLLYVLSEDLTDDECRQMKFLLYNELPRRKLDEAVTTRDVFLLMEHMDLLSETNLTLLESLVQSVCPVTTEKIRCFKATQVATEDFHGPHAQDTGRPRSMTYPSEQQQQPSRPLHPVNSASCDIPANFLTLSSLSRPEPSMSSSCMSVDANPVSGGGNLEDLSHDLRRLEVQSPKREREEPLTDSEKLRSAAQLRVEERMEEVLGAYTMTSEKRGICMIINNEDFTDSKPFLKQRAGTMVDKESLESVFTWLGFDVVTQHNCDRERMLRAVRELSRREELRRADCLVCCVLSHGCEGGMHGVDGGVVALRDLMDPFVGASCRALVGKPKMFFVQACQGTEEQAAVYVEADGPDERRLSTDARKSESIPSDADFLLGMATVHSYVSFRDKKLGSWFIQLLCQNLVKMVPMRSDLVTILTKVNADVSKMTDYYGRKKQMPQPAFTLTKNVIFPIPEAPPPSL